MLFWLLILSYYLFKKITRNSLKYLKNSYYYWQRLSHFAIFLCSSSGFSWNWLFLSGIVRVYGFLSQSSTNLPSEYSHSTHWNLLRDQDNFYSHHLCFHFDQRSRTISSGFELSLRSRVADPLVQGCWPYCNSEMQDNTSIGLPGLSSEIYHKTRTLIPYLSSIFCQEATSKCQSRGFEELWSAHFGGYWLRWGLCWVVYDRNGDLKSIPVDLWTEYYRRYGYGTRWLWCLCKWSWLVAAAPFEN